MVEIIGNLKIEKNSGNEKIDYTISDDPVKLSPEQLKNYLLLNREEKEEFIIKEVIDIEGSEIKILEHNLKVIHLGSKKELKQFLEELVKIYPHPDTDNVEQFVEMAISGKPQLRDMLNPLINEKTLDLSNID